MAAPHTHVQRASREMFAVARGKSETHIHLRNRLLAILWVTVLVDVICCLLVFLVERHAAGTQIHNLFDAFLFTTAQLLTASSVASPASNFGKVLELFFDLYALSVVATLAGSFGAFFHKRSQEHDKEKADKLAAAKKAAGKTKRAARPI